MGEWEVGQNYEFGGKQYTFLGMDGETPLWREAKGPPTTAPQSAEDAAAARLNSRGGSAVGDFLRMAAQGATFGFADELAGLGAAVVPGGKGYTEARDASRQRVEDLRTLAPGASFMAEMAGGAPVPLGGGAAVAQRVVRPGAGVAARAMARGGAGAATGAMGGGLMGAGESEATDIQGLLGDVRSGATTGAGVGGLFGLGAPLVTGGAGKVGRFVRELVDPERAGRAEATRTLRRAFGDAGIAPSEVGPRLERLGPDGVVADLDPSLARMARDARNQAPALERAGGPVSRLQQRAGGRGDRMAESLRREAGLPERMARGKELADAAVRRVREQHYRPLEEAFQSVDGPNVAAALRDPRVAAVAKRVAPDLVDEDVAKKLAEMGVPANKLPAGRPPSFRELQDVMMDLRDDASAARAAGRPNASMKSNEAYETLLSAMEQDIPGFADAQAAFRKAAKTLEAYDIGHGMKGKPASELAAEMAKLPPEAHDAFRVGLIERWEEALRTRDTGGAAAGALTNAGQELRDQVRVLFGSDEAFRRFLARTGLEETFQITERALSGNSTTAQQLNDALQSAPSSRSEVVNKVWNAIFSPGEARRIQAERVGNLLLGNNAQELQGLLTPNPVAQSAFRLAEGVPGMLGTMAAQPRGLFQ